MSEANMDYQMPMTTVGQQHFHLRIGPDEVDEFDVLEHPYAGPYYDILIDDVEEAADMWLHAINAHMNDMFDEEDMEDLFEEVVAHAGMDEPGYFGFEIDELGFILRLEECWGCIPAHSN